MLPYKRTAPYTRLSNITLAGLSIILMLVVFRGREPESMNIESNAAAQSSSQLAPGPSVRHEIVGGETQVIEVPVEQGKLLSFSIDKGDLLLSTALYAPSGERMLQYRSQDLESVQISAPADIGGNYRIELQSGETDQVRRPFELTVGRLTPVTSVNRRDSDARHLIADAETLRVNWKESELRQALNKYDEAALIWTAISDSSTASLASLRAADVCFLLSDFSEAIKRYKSAAASAEKKSDRLAQAQALSHMGRLNSQLGQNNLAQQQVNTALDLLNSAEPNSTPTAIAARGEALLNMAEISYSRGNLKRAKEQVEEAQRLLDHDRKAQARALRFAGSIAGTLGDATRAEQQISQALVISRAINDKDGEALALMLMGLFHAFNRNFDRAVELQHRAIELFHAIGDRHSEAIAFNGLGQGYQETNKAYALDSYENALRLFESTAALDSVAVAQFKLATMYVVDNPERAIKYLERCLVLSRAIGKRGTEADALNEIAFVYASHNRPDEAARRHRQLQTFYKSIGDRRGQAIALNNYGDFLFSLPKKQQALEAYSEALPLSEAVGDKGILTTTLYNLARAHLVLGNYDVALSLVERSIKIIEDLRTNIGSPDLRALYFSGVRPHYDLCRDILMQLERARPGEGFAARAFLVSERSRARSLLDLVHESHSDLREGAAAGLLMREREVGSQITILLQRQWDLSRESKADPAEAAEVSRMLAQLNVSYQEIQARLRAENPRQSALANFELQDIEQVQQALRPGNNVLLEYGLGEERSYLWAITSNSFHSYQLPGRRIIEDAVKEVYELITAREKFAGDYQTNVGAADKILLDKARSLSQILLGPVADDIGNKTLVFVTEGALQLAPFEALPVPRSRAAGPDELERRIIETNEVVAVPSMSTLLAMREAITRSPSRSRLVAVIADPVFGPSDERVEKGGLSPVVAHAESSKRDGSAASFLRDGGVARLAYASEEANVITAMAPRGSVMVAKGFDASREVAMSPRIGEYQIVHFATHGFVDSEHPESSAMVLTMVDEKGAEINGLMPLHDIYNLDLSAQLTVLSACQTALGKDIKGEGLVGLTHSFLSAGSKSVVASRWKVDDRATAVLMAHFYESMFREGLPPAAALRAAKLKMMRDENWSAPYYWAGFVFQGDYEARIVIENKSYLRVVLALVALILLSSGLLIFLRRRRRWLPIARS